MRFVLTDKKQCSYATDRFCIRASMEPHDLEDARMSRAGAGRPQRSIPPASITEVAASVRRIQSMSRTEKEALCNDLFKHQPNLLGHVLALSTLNVPMVKVDRVLHVLMVLYDLFASARPGQLPMVSEDELEHIDDNHWAFLKLIDSEEPAEAHRLIQLAASFHPEANAFAYAICEMVTSRIADLTSKEDEYCVRSVRNLVDAFARARRDEGCQA